MNPHHVVDQHGARVIPNVAIETSLLVEKFKGERPGFEASYREMSDLIGRDIRAYHGYLASARRILLRDHGILLDVIRGVGVRICNDDQKVNASARDMSGARRALGRASRKLESVDYTRLSEDKKREYTARTSLLGGLKLLGAPAAVVKIMREGAQEMMPTAKVLELFQK